LPALKRRSEKIGWIEGHNLEGIVGCFLQIGPLVNKGVFTPEDVATISAGV
jgi:hypothetical protein